MRSLFSSAATFSIVSLSLAACCLAGSQAPVRGTRVHLPPAQTPYTAEFKITTVKTLANGTATTVESTAVRAMDAQGRTVTVTNSEPSSGQEKQAVMVFDPVAGTRTLWSTPGKQATVVSTRRRIAASPCPQTLTAPRRDAVTQDLGVETIDGVEARGRRTTVTIPAGAIGNNEPLESVTEAWTAISIHPATLVVRELRDDPNTGKTTRELTSLTIGEPDAALFQPPQGYELVNKEPAQVACPAANAAVAVQPEHVQPEQ